MAVAARPTRRLASARVRLSQLLRRRVLPSDRFALAALVAAAGVLGWLADRRAWLVPPAALSVLLVVGGFLLTRRSLLTLFLVTGAVLAALWAGGGAQLVSLGEAAVVGATGMLTLAFARGGDRLGVQRGRGESMLVDLRDRLRAQGEMPELPPGWQAEVVLRNAYGAAFSGDFLVATRSAEHVLEIAVVDVSGKGFAAGSRALLLSGAFGGLLGAMPREDFLPAANDYLLRQDWDEGFATAAHLVVDLRSGDYWVASAGHPPAAQFLAGSGRWRVCESAAGPLLGVLPRAGFVAEKGRLDRGDALLLYTDGLIETPGRDLSVGIDRLLGAAEGLVTRGFRDGAHALVDSVDVGEADDRALVLLWRD